MGEEDHGLQRLSRFPYGQTEAEGGRSASVADATPEFWRRDLSISPAHGGTHWVQLGEGDTGGV